MNLSHPESRAQCRGAALVTILALLVLLSGLIVAFFLAVQMETISSTAQTNLTKLHRLRELPLKIIEEQIWGATTKGQTGSLGAVTHTWASQPGAIRVFDNQGNLDSLYKLYSSSRMEESNTSFLANEIPTDWPSRTNQYVDLNRPFPSATNPSESTYPILDPAISTFAEGVSLSNDPAGKSPAAMPVEWLYVLQNGSIVPLSGVTDASNPPTARIAFWTDDESCKINVNTAGERTFWDRPWTGHDMAGIFRYNQPSTGEYNAYPGHPATVSLSAVFGKSVPDLSSADLVKSMLALTPRYAWGGSEDATITTYDPRTELNRTIAGSTVKNDRLLATPSELVYNSDREISNDLLTSPLEKAGFLLTSSSRSPELNLFGMPRIGLWPIDTDPDKRTVYDNLIARATTIGSQPFYFQRSNPLTDNEATVISRNWELMQYLDRLTSRPVPGFGGTFSAKYGSAGNRQILTEMFDFIRSGVNLCDTSRTQAEFSKQFTPATSTQRGTVLPTRIPSWNTRGFGRLPVVTNVGLVLYAYNQTGYTGTPPATLPDDAETDVHMFLWFNFVSPLVGVAPYSTTYKIVLKDYAFGLSDPNSEDPPTFFALTNTTSNRFTFTDQGQDWGGYESMIGISTGVGTVYDPLKGSYEFHSSTPIPIKGPNMVFHGGKLSFEIWDRQTNTLLQTYTMEFPSSTSTWPVPLSWQMRDTDTTPQQLLFMDRKDRLDSDQAPGTYNPVLGTRRSDAMSRSLDVIRGVELKHGDARLVACQDNVPESFFQPAKDYQNPDRRIACSLLFKRDGLGLVRIMGGENDRPEFGKAVKVKYHDEKEAWYYARLISRPPLPAHFEGTPFTSLLDMGWSGDIDAGMNGEPDGPFMNKPDEGFIATGNGTQSPYFRSMNLTVDGKRIRSWDPTTQGFFSPTRQIPSAIQFGSLPTGVRSNAPWRTLLFSPNSQAAIVKGSHPGAASPHDYLYLDLFTMPVVEPYAISEPFSTAGKLNLNQQLIPFGHIHRETALHALLKKMKIISNVSDPAASPNAQEEIYWYKHANDTEPAFAPKRQHHIHSLDVDKTLDQIRSVWNADGTTGGRVFRSASEFCNVFLITEDMGSESPEAYWAKHQLTADNIREAPYNYLYPLLTTQSNTYQVHYLVQTLTPQTNHNNYDPSTDFTVTGEMQGSYTLERYLDVNDPDFTGSSPTVDPLNTPLSEYYKFRVLRHSAFTPSP